MRLISEQFNELEILTENTQAGKTMYLHGPMLQAVTKNRNGRVYPKNILEQAVDAYVTNYIKESRAIGELNHPERPFADPRHAAIMVEGLEWQGDLVIGKAKILPTPDGQIIRALIESGFKGGVSSRGLGEISEQSGVKTVTQYLLNAIDYVDKPSGQTCYPSAIFEDAREWVMEKGIWVEKQNMENIGDLFMEKFEELLFNLKKGK